MTDHALGNIANLGERYCLQSLAEILRPHDDQQTFDEDSLARLAWGAERLQIYIKVSNYMLAGQLRAAVKLEEIHLYQRVLPVLSNWSAPLHPEERADLLMRMHTALEEFMKGGPATEAALQELREFFGAILSSDLNRERCAPLGAPREFTVRRHFADPR